MTPFTKRNLLVPVSLALFAGVLYCLVFLAPSLKTRVQHLELLVISLLILMTFVVMLFWVSLGVLGGLSCFLLAMIFIYRPLTDLNTYYYSVLILAFFANSFFGHYIHRSINKCSREYAVTMEKVEEDTNLIKNHLGSRVAEISAMEGKIDSLLKLKNISDKLSLSFSVDEVIDIVVNGLFEKLGNDVRALFYIADEKDKSLSLFRTLKAGGRKAAIMKKGGIFDRWVMKNTQSLLVKDVRKDFRFSVTDDEKEEDFISLISKPLISEGNVLGILRVDSPRQEAFGQHELRILDIVGELAAVALKNARLYRKTEELAIKDSLTGLYVHRYFMERLEEEVKRALRVGSSFAMLMIDIDNFKKFNDNNGHIAGDAILKNVSRILASEAAAGDIVSRYGGEEFAFVALHCGRERAVSFAGNIRKKIEESRVTIRREKKNVTVSVGVAVFPEDAKLRDDIINEADKRLYEAKSAGKNRVCVK